MEGNMAHIDDAPVTAIFAYDPKFYSKMDKLFTHNLGMKGMFEGNAELALDTAIRN